MGLRSQKTVNIYVILNERASYDLGGSKRDSSLAQNDKKSFDCL